MRAIVFTALLLALSVAGCRSRSCADTIKQQIPVGSSLEVATKALMQCGFKIQLDTQKRTVYGDARTKDVPTVKRTQVLIQLDGNDRVVSVDVSTGLIGP